MKVIYVAKKGALGGIFVGEKIREGGMGELYREDAEASDIVDRFRIYQTAKDTLLPGNSVRSFISVVD